MHILYTYITSDALNAIGCGPMWRSGYFLAINLHWLSFKWYLVKRSESAELLKPELQTEGKDWALRMNWVVWSQIVGASSCCISCPVHNTELKALRVWGGELASNGGRCLHCGGRMKTGQRVSSSLRPESWRDRMTAAFRGEYLTQWSSPLCSGGPCFFPGLLL